MRDEGVGARRRGRVHAFDRTTRREAGSGLVVVMSWRHRRGLICDMAVPVVEDGRAAPVTKPVESHRSGGLVTGLRPSSTTGRPRLRRMPSRTCTPCTRGWCPASARRERWRATSRPSARGSSLAHDAGPQPAHSAVPRFERRWSVVREELAGFPSYVITPRRRAPTRTVVYLHGGGFMAPISACQVRYALGWRRPSARGWCCPTTRSPPSTPGATPSTRSPRWPPAGASSPAEIVLAGDSSGGGYALALALAAPRPRGCAADPSRAARALGRPDHQHARDGSLRRGRPVAVHRQAARLRAVVGRLARRPRPPRGHARPGRPARAAAARSSSTAPATCSRRAAGCSPAARPEGRLGPHPVEEHGLLHVYPILPVLPEARAAFRQTLAFLR